MTSCCLGSCYIYHTFLFRILTFPFTAVQLKNSTSVLPLPLETTLLRQFQNPLLFHQWNNMSWHLGVIFRFPDLAVLWDYRDGVHASESLLSKDSADAGRHTGKLSPGEIRNTRLQDLHATQTVQLSAHNTCNVHGWLTVSKQSCFYCRRRLDFVLCLSCFPAFGGHSTTSKPCLVWFFSA